MSEAEKQQTTEPTGLAPCESQDKITISREESSPVIGQSFLCVGQQIPSGRLGLSGTRATVSSLEKKAS